MRLYYTEEMERLRRAHARAGELRSEWPGANTQHYDADRHAEAHRGMVRAARATAGRTLVGLGRLISPRDMQPCQDA
jgi:hypothetical protein